MFILAENCVGITRLSNEALDSFHNLV